MTRKYTLYVGAPATTAEVAQRVANFTDAATITNALGLWKGKTEVTVVVEIIAEDARNWTRTLARDLRLAFDQDAVLWTVQEVETYLFERD